MKYKIGQNIKVKNSYPPLWGPIISIDEENKIYMIKINYIEYLNRKDLCYYTEEAIHKKIYSPLWYYREEDLESGY